MVLNVVFFSSQVHQSLQEMPDFPEVQKDAFYPLEQFFAAEVEVFRATRDVILTDIEQLLNVVRGLVPETPPLRRLLDDVSRRRIPVAWQRQSYPSSIPLPKYAQLPMFFRTILS